MISYFDGYFLARSHEAITRKFKAEKRREASAQKNFGRPLQHSQVRCGVVLQETNDLSKWISDTNMLSLDADFMQLDKVLVMGVNFWNTVVKVDAYE